METALFELLQKVPGLRDRIGQRIYPLELPQGGQKPAITYQRVSGRPDYDMGGTSGLVESRYFISFYGVQTRDKSAYSAAREIRDLVVAFLTPNPGYTDLIGTTEIQGVFIHDEDDRRLDDATGGGVVRVQLDCSFWHRDTEGS